MKASKIRNSAAIVALLTASPALADITAQEVWESWKSSAGGFGQTLSAGSEQAADGTLTLDDVTSEIAFPEGTASSSIDRVVMQDQGDGTVRITLEGAYTVRLDTQPEDGPPVAMAFDIAAPGMEMIASGSAADTTYDYGADSLSLVLAELQIAGAPAEGSMEITMEQPAGLYRVADGDGMAVDSTLDAAQLLIALDMVAPDGSGNRIAINADYADFSTASSMSAQDGATMEDPEAFVSGAITLTAEYGHGGGGYMLDGTGADGAMSFSSRSTGGNMLFSIDERGLSLSMGNTGVEMAASGAQIPFPELTLAADEIAGVVALPLQQADEASELALELTLDGLTVSDMLWAMVDPSGALPRDPATLLIDIGGLVRLTADLTDEAAMNAPVPPVDFEALDLENLTLSIAGATLTGSGGFDFSQAPEGAIPGMPGVAGTANLRLEGGNTLLDTLVAMGLVPEDQAGMARMMMGALARPVGDDALETEIELGPDGSIRANGNQLR
jgi:hypothetical protein